MSHAGRCRPGSDPPDPPSLRGIGPRTEAGLQVGVFSVFNPEEPEYMLMDSDYVASFTLSHRAGAFFRPRRVFPSEHASGRRVHQTPFPQLHRGSVLRMDRRTAVVEHRPPNSTVWRCRLPRQRKTRTLRPLALAGRIGSPTVTGLAEGFAPPMARSGPPQPPAAALECRPDRTSRRRTLRP